MHLPVVALRGLVVFPNNVVHFEVGREKSIAAVGDLPLIGIAIGHVDFPQIPLQVTGIHIIGDAVVVGVMTAGETMFSEAISSMLRCSR
jgi:hypothetical protein